MTRAYSIGSVALLAGVMGFLGGLFGHDRMPALTQRVAAAAAFGLGASDTPPAWVDEYAKAFCAADAGTIAAKLDDSYGLSEADVRSSFDKRDWKCDTVRYLGTSAGEKGTAYVIVMHDPATKLENWWVFTVRAGRIVGLD